MKDFLNYLENVQDTAITDGVSSCCAEKLRLAFYLKIAEEDTDFPYPDKDNYIYWKGDDFVAPGMPGNGLCESGDVFLRASALSVDGSFGLLVQALDSSGFAAAVFSMTTDIYMEGGSFDEIFNDYVIPFLQDNSPDFSKTEAAWIYNKLEPYACPEPDGSNVLILAGRDIGFIMENGEFPEAEPLKKALQFITDSFFPAYEFFPILINGVFYLFYVFYPEEIIAYNGMLGETDGIHPLYFYALKVIKDTIKNKGGSNNELRNEL